MRSLIVAGTDTDVGKTVFAAALAAATDRYYWKPVQAGNEDGGDSATVASLGVPSSRILPEAYSLETPASPHRAAEIDGVTIAHRNMELPECSCIVETAGGVLVPLTRDTLYIDVMARWGAPVVLVARTALGTINHSLLSLESLRARGIAVLGIAFIGPANEDSERTICEMGAVRRLGRLPILDDLTADSLSSAFSSNFNLDDFA
ncbi:ATP-dependent dethiobiotin synthetase BioD [Altererythrobacter sp. SALINAS58]|uniref:dethiobiotin synthase n=1 Tax=Alteripontixanthobacter muriae TaxID=2705546 RepID=UPI00157671BF|nr:dethiobiotin synthase [Alteripontixanthobacter muriae]NTZ41553.1 ATP-dependent dethiobiotin synthetase BioD [Alteripontixanthobacter muriae]